MVQLSGYRNLLKRTFITKPDSVIDLSPLNKIEGDLDIAIREYGIFSKIINNFRIDPKDVPSIYKYNNTLMLGEREDILKQEYDKLSTGLSGCPILDNMQLVVGIYLGKKPNTTFHYMLLSKYIRYRTHYNYDTYSDLPIRFRHK